MTSPGTQVITFFVLAYAISWAWVIPLAATGHTVVQGKAWPTHFPSLLGPLLAAFIVAASSRRDGVRRLVAGMIRWRIGWRWWFAATNLLVCFGLSLAAMALLGVDLPPRNDFARFSGLPVGLGSIGVALVVIIVNGFGEETGWRGYALPRLQNRLGPLVATLVVAAAWAGWHIPQFFLLGSYESFSAPMLPVFVFGLACGAVVCTWLYNHTNGSILAVAAWHGLYNVTGATKAASAGSGVLAAAMWTFVVFQGLVLLTVEWRARRRGHPSILAAPAAPTAIRRGAPSWNELST